MTWDGGSIREEMPPNHSPVSSTDPAPATLPGRGMAPEGLLGGGSGAGEGVVAHDGRGVADVRKHCWDDDLPRPPAIVETEKGIVLLRGLPPVLGRPQR